MQNPIFIGGMPRSGTTLLRVMLDSHPAIACGPELRVFPAITNFCAQLRANYASTLASHYAVGADRLNEIFRSLAESFLEPYAAQRGRSRIGEKTPANVLRFDELCRLFPDGRCIHIIRDGRDVVCSLLEMDWTDAQGRPLDITRDAAAAAIAWAAHVRAGQKARADGFPVHELRYEKLVENCEYELRDLLGFLGEDWDDAVLAHDANPTAAHGMKEQSAVQVAQKLHPRSIGRWKERLSPKAKLDVKRCAGDLLIELGYAADDEW